MTSPPASWPTEWLAALDDEALIAASSKAIFTRGKTYATAGVIEVIGEEGLPEPSLRAEIQGTELYTTEVWIEDDEIAGDCDCPNAADGWFCKHQVALALFWRARLTGVEPELDEAAQKKVAASAKRAQTIKDKRLSLEEFLHAQEVRTLANKLLEFADYDRGLERELYRWQKIESSRNDPAEFKTLITELLATHGFIDYYASTDFARQGRAVLPLLEKACAQDAEAGLKLAMHALERCWRALGHADDSNGEIGGLCEEIGEAFVAALKAAGPRPERFGKTYFDLVDKDPFGCFNSREAEATIGPQALAHFRELLAKRWRAAKDAVLAARVQGRKRNLYIFSADDPDIQLRHYERLYIEQLEASGEIDVAIAVLSEDLSDASAHNSLIYFLEKHGRHREAFVAAERANKAFPHDSLLESRLLDCYRRDGWHAEALTLQRQRFECMPSLRAYQDVLEAAKSAKADLSALREDMLSFLKAREDAELKNPRAVAHRNAAGHKGPYVELRAQVLCAESRWLDALALVQPPALCSAQTLEDLALHLPKTHTAEAIVLLKRVFDTVMPASQSPYKEALHLVEEIAGRMTPGERQTWLTALRTTYKAKRNFIRDLPSN